LIDDRTALRPAIRVVDDEQPNREFVQDDEAARRDWGGYSSRRAWLQPTLRREISASARKAQLDDKVGVIVLTNTNDSNPADIARKLMATVGQAVAKASAPKPAAVAWDPACALRGTLPRARRRFARRAAESETGHHHAQRDER
jgi:hypothetical protein